MGALGRRPSSPERLRALRLRRSILDPARQGDGGGRPPSELQELLNAFGFVLTEKQVVPSAVVDDIDFGAVRSFMEAQGLDTEQAPQPAREHDLRNASVVDDFDGILRPTLYGLMVFGRDPQGASPHPEPVRAVRRLRRLGPGRGGADRRRREGTTGRSGEPRHGLVSQPWEERELPGSLSQGHSGDPGERVGAKPWSTPSSTGTTPSPALRCCWKCSTTASW